MCSMWKFGNSANPSRFRKRVMRKSQRIRILELEVLRQQYELEYIKATVSAFLESNNFKIPELDAGKWYSPKQNRK